MKKRILPGLISLLLFGVVIGASLSVVNATEVEAPMELYSSNYGLSVIFNSNGVDALNMPLDITGINPGDYVSIPNPPRAQGMAFEGWYLDPQCKIPFVFKNPVERDMILYAKWSGSQWDTPVNNSSYYPVEVQESQEIPESTEAAETIETPPPADTVAVETSQPEGNDNAGDEVVINHDDTAVIESDPVKTAEAPETWLYILVTAFAALIIFTGFAFSAKNGNS